MQIIEAKLWCLQVIFGIVQIDLERKKMSCRLNTKIWIQVRIQP